MDDPLKDLEALSNYIDTLTAQLKKATNYPFEKICLLCGKLEPCMTEADLKPEDPGVPCTFDRTPKELMEDNKLLRKKLKEATDRLREHHFCGPKIGHPLITHCDICDWIKENL